jgi:hypothetical protein
VRSACPSALHRLSSERTHTLTIEHYFCRWLAFMTKARAIIGVMSNRLFQKDTDRIYSACPVL